MAEKIYCIKCGREIKDGLLYCDRCGQSVKKSKEQQSKNKDKRKQAEEIHREQINRKKRRQEKEIKKQANRRKARHRAAVLGIIIGILILGAVSAFIAYIWMAGSSDIIWAGNTTAPASPEPTAVQTTEVTGGSNTFSAFEHNGITCPYPSNFSEQTPASGELARRSDGSAVMTVAEEAFTPAADAMETARALMEQRYDEVSSLGGTVTDNRFGAGWYVITYETGSRVCHRKCVISGASALSYTFEYDKNSPNADEYEACFNTLDDNFTGGAGSQS